jgi:hypothetical protein
MTNDLAAARLFDTAAPDDKVISSLKARSAEVISEAGH